MDEKQLKEWLRENLHFEVKRLNYGVNFVVVGLRFKEEDTCFTYDYISIPDDE